MEFTNRAVWAQLSPSRDGYHLLLVSIGAVAFWVASIVFAAVAPAAYGHFAREDGLFELVQLALLLACTVFGAAVAWNLFRLRQSAWAFLYCVATLILLWVAGEEISWGQRIFDWRTPELLGANLQGESNLHNLPSVSLSIHRVTNLALLLGSLASLVLWTRGRAKQSRWCLHLWMPPPALIPVWLCFLSYTLIRELDLWYFDRTRVHFSVGKLQESAEVILYAGVLAFLVTACVQVRAEAKRALPG